MQLDGGRLSCGCRVGQMGRAAGHERDDEPEAGWTVRQLKMRDSVGRYCQHHPQEHRDHHSGQMLPPSVVQASGQRDSAT